MRFAVCLIVVCALSFTLAHKPFFPEGESPYDIGDPTTSQAHYLQIASGEVHRFLVPPLTEVVPIEVLVLDNELGRSLDMEAVWICEGSRKTLTKVDQSFFEEFSQIEHRYKTVDGVGPTTEACEVEIRELTGKAGPYTFAIGAAERFNVADLLGFFSLGDKLANWQAGEDN